MAPIAPSPDRRRGRRQVLVRVLELLLDTARSDPALAPSAVGITVAGDDVELAVRPLIGADPVADVHGFVAPPEWTAFGVVASGTARPLGPGATIDHPTQVLFGILQPRSGRGLSVVRARD